MNNGTVDTKDWQKQWAEAVKKSPSLQAAEERKRFFNANWDRKLKEAKAKEKTHAGI